MAYGTRPEVDAGARKIVPTGVFGTPAGRYVVAMISVEHLTKRYGEKTAVDALTFTVRPGVVTGFLGPNGAGKSTTRRVIAVEPRDGLGKSQARRLQWD